MVTVLLRIKTYINTRKIKIRCQKNVYEIGIQYNLEDI